MRVWHELTKPRALRTNGTRKQRRSGIALLVAMSTVLVLTVVVTELSYNARVRYLIAAHEKERAQAYWVSQTGINLYKLLLGANKQMEGSAAGGVAVSWFLFLLLAVVALLFSQRRLRLRACVFFGSLALLRSGSCFGTCSWNTCFGCCRCGSRNWTSTGC